MYEEHPSFNPPPDNAVLWRYMDFTKFVSLLDKSALFFVRADRLRDPFEGTITDVNVIHRTAFYETLPKESLRRERLNVEELIRQFALISCWHEGSYESAAMWSLYSREKDGIAINTNFDSFKQSFIGNTDVYVGRVRYIDYSLDHIPEGNIFNPFLHKRHSFAHEREVRAMNIISGDKGFSQPAYDVGRYFKVDLSLLIKEVIVAPYAEDWFLELVQSVATRYTLKAPVSKSRLADKPRRDPGFPVLRT